MSLREQARDQSAHDTKSDDQSIAIESQAFLLQSIGESLEQSGDAVIDSFIRLYRAYQFAEECNRSPWEFAIEMKQLQRTGITTEEIRWLLGKNLVNHAEENLSLGQTTRTFQSPGGFRLSDKSCLILTDLGVQAAQHTIESIQSKPVATNNDSHNTANLTPRWDVVRHELRLGSILVKKFKWRASNQEAILNAFEEDGWPAHIDDPLTQDPEMNPKRRLSDTIKCLNRKQKNALIRFCGDGTGEGVLWELVEPTIDSSGPVNLSPGLSASSGRID